MDKNGRWELGMGEDEKDSTFHGLFKDPTAINVDEPKESNPLGIKSYLQEAEKATIIMGIGIGLALGIPILAIFGGAAWAGRYSKGR